MEMIKDWNSSLTTIPCIDHCADKHIMLDLVYGTDRSGWARSN